jgi:hypothetical protein
MQPCALFERVPHAILLVIFSLLPVDMRLRCREVCPAWRAVLSAERSLWVRLDLSVSSGLLARRVTPALLRAAAALAGGQLEALNVSDSDNVVAEAGAGGCSCQRGHASRAAIERRGKPQLRVAPAS